MAVLRTALLVVGGLLALVGLIWMGQGSGYFPYPASSFMIDERVWITRGLATCVAGVALALVSRRL